MSMQSRLLSLSILHLLHLLVSGLLMFLLITQPESTNSKWQPPNYESDWMSATAIDADCIELTTLDCTG